MTQTATERKPLPLGERLNIARKEARITNARIAAELGVDPRTVAGWQGKKPRSRPSYERLLQIAALLGKTPSYFLDEDQAA